MTGTGALIRLILRRDRIILPLWVILLALLPVIYGAGNESLFSGDQERLAYAAGIRNSPAQRALVGPLFADNLGAITAWRLGFGLVIIGLASLLTVIRHTRVEEELGRRELVGAGVVGRSAPLAAAVIVTMSANLVMGLLAAALTPFHGTGALALGLGMTLTGWVFTAIGAVAAQLTESARGARGLAGAVLAAAYLLRAAGDAGGPGAGLSWLSWLSPVAWAQQLRPYADERWWVLAVPILSTVVFLVLAARLSANRDVGAGLLPARLGPATAAGYLRSPLALAWRLHRGVLLSWTIGVAVFGLAIGAIAADVATQFGDSAQLREILAVLGGPAGIVDAFVSTGMGIIALAVSGYAISAALRLRSEEEAGHVEPLLAAGVSRFGFAVSHLTFALLGPAWLLLVAGLTAGLLRSADEGDAGQIGRVVGAALVQLPAVWVLAGLAVALFGLVPRLAATAWAVLLAFFLLGQIGGALRLDQWALDLSPYTHIPKLPAADLAVAPLLWLTLIAAALVAAGLIRLRTRNIPS